MELAQKGNKGKAWTRGESIPRAELGKAWLGREAGTGRERGVQSQGKVEAGARLAHSF